MKTAFWISFAAAVAVYLGMVLWTLPAISQAAGGLVPFDMRPGGYSGDEARLFLAQLSDDGRALYLGTQHLLDSIYPALLGLTLVLAMLLVYPGAAGKIGAVLAVFAAGADYLENVAVTIILKVDLTLVSDAMVATASRWTLLKSGLSSVVFVALLLGVSRLVWRRWKA